MRTEKSKYLIGYNHTSSDYADDYDAALGCVAEQALVCEGGKWDPVSARKKLIIIDTPDGDFVYLNQEDCDADDTGISAFAVIDRIGKHE